MHKLDIEQNSEVWLEFRKYKVGGSKIKALKPLSRGRYKGVAEGAAGFWKLIAERLSLGKDGEDERERGHRLEQRALELTNQKHKLKLVKGKIWQSEDNERSYISPDGEEDSPEPVYAQETKAFDPDKHLRLIWEDLQTKKLDEYRAFNSIPDEHKDQVVRYFVINDKLQKLYWTLINDLVAYEEMEHYSIVVDRDSIEQEIAEQIATEKVILKRSDQIVRELVDALVKQGGR